MHSKSFAKMMKFVESQENEKKSEIIERKRQNLALSAGLKDVTAIPRGKVE